jgi:citrate lyase subunit beta/citryl-CoA lyase
LKGFSMQGLPLSSYLLVPGNRPERFAKAGSAGAGAVIVDLEDAVAPGEKVTARAAVAAWLSAEHSVLVRINSADTEWFRNDVEMCRGAGVVGVVLPKAERVEDVRYVGQAGAVARGSDSRAVKVGWARGATLLNT